jgi:hypothetical protein
MKSRLIAVAALLIAAAPVLMAGDFNSDGRADVIVGAGAQAGAAAKVSPGDRLSPDLQRRLEAQGGARTSTSKNLKQLGLAMKPGEPSKYVCQGSTCTCAGAYDCVKMISADGKCKEGEGHTQCNDSGCTCDAK